MVILDHEDKVLALQNLDDLRNEMLGKLGEMENCTSVGIHHWGTPGHIGSKGDLASRLAAEDTIETGCGRAE